VKIHLDMELQAIEFDAKSRKVKRLLMQSAHQSLGRRLRRRLIGGALEPASLRPLRRAAEDLWDYLVGTNAAGATFPFTENGFRDLLTQFRSAIDGLSPGGPKYKALKDELVDIEQTQNIAGELSEQLSKHAGDDREAHLIGVTRFRDDLRRFFEAVRKLPPKGERLLDELKSLAKLRDATDKLQRDHVAARARGRGL